MKQTRSITKSAIHSHCISLLDERIKASRDALSSLQDAARNESKSSMGDKYETARAMIHLEIEKQQLVLQNLLGMNATLARIDPDHQCGRAELGAIVETNNGIFFIAVNLGEIMIDNKPVFVISAKAPLAEKFRGITEGERVEFNKRTYLIERIY